MTQGISGIPSRDISRFTLNAAPAAVALATLTGHLVHANPAFHTLFELPMRALQEGVSFIALCGDAAAATLMESVARDGHTRHGELDILNTTQPGRRILCIASRVEDKQATPVWLACVCFELQSQHLIEHRRLHELHHFLDAQRLIGNGSWQVRIHTGDLNTHAMLWSAALSQLLGYPPQITEQPVSQFLQHVHPQDRANWLTMLEHATEGVGQSQLSYRLLVRNGSTLAMRSRSRCSARQPDGTLTVIGIEQDLSELDELRQALEHNSLLLNGAVEAHAAPVYAVDCSLRYTCYNAAHRDSMLRDYGQEPRLGHKATPGLPGSVYQRQIQDHLRRALAGQEVVHDTSTDAGDSASIDHDVVYRPLLNSSGEITGVMVSHTTTRLPSSQRAPRHWQD